MSKPKLRKRLSNMTIREISLVDAGANPGATVEITKRNPPKEADMPAATPDDQEPVILFAIEGQDGEDPIVFTDADAAELDDLLQETNDLLETASDEDAASVEKIAKAAFFSRIFLEHMLDQDDALANAAEEINKRDAQLQGYEQEFAKRNIPTPTVDDEEGEIDQLSERLRKRLECGEVALDEVAKMRAEAERKEWIAKAEKARIPQAEVIGDLCIRIAKRATTEEDAKLFLALMSNAASVQKNAELLNTLGERGGDATTAEAQLAVETDTILKAARAQGQAMTKEQAIAKAYQNNPELYQRYREENSVTRR